MFGLEVTAGKAMKSRTRSLLVATFALVLLCGCIEDRDQSETVQATSSEQLALSSLDPSDPAQLAVIQWHRALVTSDFATFSAVQVRGTDDNDEMRELAFDVFQQGAPQTIAVHDGTQDLEKLYEPSDKSWKGSRLFALVGCINGANDGRRVRVMSVVSVRKVLGEWKVYGGSFGAPSTPFAGGCPIRSGK